MKTSQLPWTGLLNPQQIARLKEECPNVVVCPGCTSRFGAADDDGFVYIPGAGHGYHFAKRALTNWHARVVARDSKVAWWLDELEDEGKGITPIMSHDVLDGLPHDRWVQYLARYKRAQGARQQRLYQVRKRAAVLEARQHDKRAARDLVGLSRRRDVESTTVDKPRDEGGDGQLAGSLLDEDSSSSSPSAEASSSPAPSNLARRKIVLRSKRRA